MSYRVVTSPGLPFVHSLRATSGLGQLSPPPAPLPPSAPWWGQLIQSVGVPLAQGTASRIAYGSTPYYPSSFQFSTPYGAYGGGAYGSFQPSSMLLLGGAAILVLMLMKN